MSWIEGWFLFILVVMVNNSTNINKNHLWPQLIEWWSTILPISTKITSHLNSLSDVDNSTNINKNHLSLQLIEWWLTIPPISTKITSHLISLSDGQQFHQYHHKSPLTSTHWVSQQFHQNQQESPLTSTHWVMVNNSTNINKNHLSLQLIEWWSTIPPISANITSHLNSLSDGQQFHQYQQKSPLTSTHWVMVNNSTNIKSPLTWTHWVMVNNSTNINNNYLSLQLIEWWSTIPPIST